MQIAIQYHKCIIENIHLNVPANWHKSEAVNSWTPSLGGYYTAFIRGLLPWLFERTSRHNYL